MLDLRVHPIVRALAEAVYSRVVPDLSRPAWFMPVLGSVDDLPARMQTLEVILDSCGSLIWESPPRPKFDQNLTAMQRDIQWGISVSAPDFYRAFKNDLVAMLALAATIMSWGAKMPPSLRETVAGISSDTIFFLELSSSEEALFKEIICLVSIYQEGSFITASCLES